MAFARNASSRMISRYRGAFSSRSPSGRAARRRSPSAALAIEEHDLTVGSARLGLDGRFTEEFYYASPVHFLPRLEDPDHLALLGTRSIHLVSGEGPHESPTQAYTMARVLGDRGVPNRVDLWGPAFDHEWEAWRTQLPAYLAGLA